MAQWILVFTPPDVPPHRIAETLAGQPDVRVELSADGEVVDVQRGHERVEFVQDDTVLREYEVDEIAHVLADLPRPSVLRVSYYRGTDLLSDVLGRVAGLSDRIFVDNDYGVVARLDAVLSRGVTAFLASRG